MIATYISGLGGFTDRQSACGVDATGGAIATAVLERWAYPGPIVFLDLVKVMLSYPIVFASFAYSEQVFRGEQLCPQLGEPHVALGVTQAQVA